MTERAIAALYHDVKWNCSDKTIAVSDGIIIGDLKNSPLNSTYEKLCKNHKVDEGEPFDFDIYALFSRKDITKDEILFCFGVSDTIVDRFSNILAMTIKQPISMCRLIWSEDNFMRNMGTERLYYSSDDIANVFWDDRACVSDIDSNNIVLLWDKFRSIYRRYRYDNRLINILNYYYMAWRSNTLEQLFINMSIVIELLFAPHSKTEVGHQIAFNISRFMGNSSDERRNIYNNIKKFYAIRSAIVHGGIPNTNNMTPLVRNVYLLITDMMVRILSDDAMSAIFAEENKRKELLGSYMFN